MLCSNLLCFDSDFAVFGILFSCLRLQECSFSPGKRVFSEVEHRVWLVWCLVRCVRSGMLVHGRLDGRQVFPQKREGADLEHLHSNEQCAYDKGAHDEGVYAQLQVPTLAYQFDIQDKHD